MALTNARNKAMVDAELADAGHHNYLALSTNGASEDPDTPRRPITFTTPAAANPYAPANTVDITFSPTHAAGTKSYTHCATCAGGVNGTADLDTIWMPITDPDPIVGVGGTTTISAGTCKPVSSNRTTTS